MPEKHIVASVATESIKDITTIENGFTTESKPSEVVTVVPDNTDYTRFLNFLNQMKIKYKSDFIGERNPTNDGERFAHFTINGENIYEYWEIELEDCILTYGCCVFVFKPDQTFIGIMAE